MQMQMMESKRMLEWVESLPGARGAQAARSARTATSSRIAAVLATLPMLVLGTAAAADDGLPLVLTNENIGMSAEDIEAQQGPDDFKDLDAEAPDAFQGEPEVLELSNSDVSGGASTVAPDSEFRSAEAPVVTGESTAAEAAEGDAPVVAAEPTAGAEAEAVKTPVVVEEPAVAEEPTAASEPAVAGSGCETEQVAGGVASFERCVEIAIRGGNGFSESSSVCGALFPAEGEPTS